MNDPINRRIDVGEVTLAWGDQGLWKERLREERLQAFSEKPLSERLRAALGMVRRRSDRGTPR